ncbi:dihydrodipicolinate reductase [Nocardia farcinica]|uniref:NAD(P)H-dependent amine dehydrogenase family protein n=1 Tax=Nocardia farcinica TaxID=37329 RepID=UPI00189593C8|nr:dihydrodipicolinate reductase [Nocardia farcinica]MBF6260983.1 dihydrodipicolinate reductase [Nocardia farcinica]MBF6279349.1 dihydrodipicolinate reductase [Nocardia farcinica]MBF6303993.1 dihydrodipicolinate reductase [Nocardia farcinica]MBF6389035.1 dihydrodipicolinate reductase [Nocardia farcinica]MBF6491644.1 dihydrodipicolinate reductase [Nocardia farcinica]
MADQPLRVIQWATGGVGRAAIEGVLDHPGLELVGAWVHSPDKDGRDLGTLVGRAEIGVRASADADALLALPADCVIYSPMTADTAVMRAILRSGKNLVTPLGWFHPAGKQRAGFDAVCREAGVTLHGTGIHPGGVTDKLPIALSAFSGSITEVHAHEYSDIRTYGAPDVVREWMRFGATPAEATGGHMAAMLAGGYGQSVRMIADALGFALDDEVRTVHEVAVATAPIESPIGVIEPGLVAGQRIRWEGTVDGAAVVTVGVNWLMGEDDLDPPWRFGPAGERYDIRIVGDPGTHAVITGMHAHSTAAGLARHPGIVATAMHCVNSVPAVVAAEPGVRTYLDLPLLGGVAAGPVHRAAAPAGDHPHS